eukprot:scaffold309921_cov43-Prasinocladus_malaysianus.AAC.1
MFSWMWPSTNTIRTLKVINSYMVLRCVADQREKQKLTADNVQPAHYLSSAQRAPPYSLRLQSAFEEGGQIWVTSEARRFRHEEFWGQAMAPDPAMHFGHARLRFFTMH